MNIDEMKNRISLALKDPILQQEFAIICKELETEKQLNAEIKARFVKCNTCTDVMKSKCLMFSENLCQGERCEELVDLISLLNKSDLEKENAELKTDMATVIPLLEKAKKISESLTKAEELLNEFMRISKTSDEDFEHDYSELIGEAEQFLKESE